jgi:nucleoid-associated protein YgaU
MEAVHRRLLIAAGVLASGILASMPFYHSSTSSAPNSADAKSATSTSDGTVSLQISGSEPGPSTESPAPSLPEAKRSNAKTPVERNGDPRVPAPQISHVHPAAREQVPPVSSIQRTIVNTTAPAPQESLEATEPVRERTHRITDGDTLERLARRYLGDASRWPEIRDANRDVLRVDDILPIGKDLRIPPRGAPRNVAKPAADSPLKVNGLVPVPWQN